MPLSKEEAIRRGIKIRPIQHSMNRRAEWNDYYLPGRYGITVHILTDEDGYCDRDTLLCDITGSCKDNTVQTRLTPLGTLVEKKIREIGEHEHFSSVRCLHHVVMPTHIHMTLEITKQLPIAIRNGKPLQLTLGHLIGGLKGGCTTLFQHLQDGDFSDCMPGDDEWVRRSAFSYDDWKAWKATHQHANNLPSRQGYIPVREGISEGLITHPIKQVPPSASKAPSLWQKNYNDKILNTTRKLEEWIYYETMNPYFWRMQDERPHLFEHRLHINVAMKDGTITDFSAYGCMFLLRKGDRAAVICHRLARKGMLTADEWARVSQPDTSRRYEQDRTLSPLGHWDRNWLYSKSPDCITPIPYTETAHFRNAKAQYLSLARQNVILISGGISAGEQDIIYSALEQGSAVIKIRRKPFTKREHPTNKDRSWCAKGHLLVLGPWEIPTYNHPSNTHNEAPSDTMYAQFHNVNEMATRMCAEIANMKLVEEDKD